MPSNTAAWLVSEKAYPFEVKAAPYTQPGPNEILVKNAAVAINPIDWRLQDTARYPLEYPTILGQDVAGEVVEVGSEVSRFSVGDRVIGFPSGMSKGGPSHSGFQEYTILDTVLAAPIPRTLSYERAVVLPLGVSTAAAGLFQKGYLELNYPSLNPKPSGKTVLVWGGSGSVGVNAIQLAVAAGYEVIATASPANFDYLKKLGASQVLDYHSKTIVDDIQAAFAGKTIAGIMDTINVGGVIQTCIEILLGVNLGEKRVASVGFPPEDIPESVTFGRIFAGTIRANEVGKVIFEDYLPKALEEGKYIPAPDPLVLEKGIVNIQAALEVQKKGVSAKKVVVPL